MNQPAKQPAKPIQVDQLRIIHYPAPMLRAKARPIDAITTEVQAVAQRMLELMHQAPGVGLAAPQVGLPWRLFVANATSDPQDDLVFINPVLSNFSRETEDQEEGCLSLPHITGQIRRPKGAVITAQNMQNQTFTLASDDLPARVWQHETDHLDGVLIIDKMTALDKKANQPALGDLEQSANG